jgi:hypothetical protein
MSLSGRSSFGAFAWFFLRFLAEEDEADMAPTP